MLIQRSGLGKRIGAVALVASVGIALAACSPGKEEGAPTDPKPTQSEGNGNPVELTFQSWVPNIDQAVNAFNESQDEIQVKLETVTAGPDGGYAKMLAAVQSGNPADVAQVGYDAIPDFLINGALEDITEYVAADAETFVDWQWQTGVFGESVYAIPQASGPLGQFYRADIFKELGIEAPQTWEQFYEAAKVVRESDPDRYIAAFAFNQAPWMIGLSQQAGGEWFKIDGEAWDVNIADEDTLKMADFWQKMLDEDLVKVVADMSNEWNADIQNGNILTWISGSWADAIIRGTAPDTAGNWAVSLVPQWEAGETASASWAGGSANVVLKGSKNPEAAAKFLVWLNSNPESVSTLTSIGAGWPSIKDTSLVASLQDDPEVFAFYGGQNIWDTFAVADTNIPTNWNWPPLSSTLFSSLTDNVKAALENKAPLRTAFEQTDSDMTAALKEKGISVVE